MTSSLSFSCPQLPRGPEMFCSPTEKDYKICLRPNLRGRLTTRKCANLGLDAEESDVGEQNRQYEIKPCTSVRGRQDVQLCRGREDVQLK